MTHRGMKVLVAALALGALATLGACGGDNASASGEATDGAKAPFKVAGEPVATDKVELPPSYKFAPAVISVKPGTAVTWENKDNFPHNVKVLNTSEKVRDLPIGGTAAITFDESGTFYYQCTLHPSQMKGMVIVEA